MQIIVAFRFDGAWNNDGYCTGDHVLTHLQSGIPARQLSRQADTNAPKDFNSIIRFVICSGSGNQENQFGSLILCLDRRFHGKPVAVPEMRVFLQKDLSPDDCDHAVCIVLFFDDGIGLEYHAGHE